MPTIRSWFVAAAVSGAAAMLCVTPYAQAATVTPVATWEMNEDLGETLMKNSSADELHGRIGSKVSPGEWFAGRKGYRFRHITPIMRDEERLVTVPNSEKLDPGTSNYRVTVTFRTGAGDQNIVQKGQSGGPFFKLDMNKGVPKCLFRGQDGSRAIGWSKPIWDSEWHTVICERTTTGVSITVDPGRADGGTRSISGPTGDISNGWKLAIGGKFYCDPSKGIGCDYFVGAIDSVKIDKF